MFDMSLKGLHLKVALHSAISDTHFKELENGNIQELYLFSTYKTHFYEDKYWKIYKDQTNNSKNSLLPHYPEKICMIVS